MPKLRSLPFETAIIERYKRREVSVEEALVEMNLAGVSVRRGGRHHRGAFWVSALAAEGRETRSTALGALGYRSSVT
jgi:transposase-like protein